MKQSNKWIVICGNTFFVIMSSIIHLFYNGSSVLDKIIIIINAYCIKDKSITNT